MTAPDKSTEAARPAPTVHILTEHQILAEALLHVLPHAAKPDDKGPPRIIQHLIIEPDGTLCATNGKTIAAHRWAVSPAPEARVLIELPDVDSSTMLRRLAKKAKKEEPLFGVTLAPSGQTMVLRVGRESLTITPAWHADEFPNWRRLFAQYRDSESRKEPSSFVGLNTDYLKLFDAVCEFTLGARKDVVIVRKSSEPNFWGAVMPVHIEAPESPFPAWCADDDFTPNPEATGERESEDGPAGMTITEAYEGLEGVNATMSVNGGPAVDMKDIEALKDALAPVFDELAAKRAAKAEVTS